ncbi:MAG TPA: dihydroneopterin aldolase [Bacteroidia bacterium]|nr:dihydroneopterin aldolase [Bacteroidia bacterium]
MGIINVNGIRIYAYHGCLPEEGKIGGEYVVDVTITGDFSKAESSDELADTVDYCVVYETVKREMAIRSKLIEHVAKRILDGLRKDYPAVEKFDVQVTKINPPMGGAVDHVSVIVAG